MDIAWRNRHNQRLWFVLRQLSSCEGNLAMGDKGGKKDKDKSKKQKAAKEAAKAKKK